MSGLTWKDVAGVILKEIRATYSNGRKPDDEITEAWARTLARSRRVYPATVWREAVTVWAVSHSDPPSPHDIITAAGQVVDQWELIPERRSELNGFRQERLAAKFGPGYGAHESGQLEYDSKQRELPGKRSDMDQNWRELRAGIKARAAARAENNNPPESAEEGA